MISRTSIEEANRHLNLLHGRVADLEKTVKEQHEALVSKDEFLQNKLSEISSAKEKETQTLQQKLLESERTVSLLQKQMEDTNQELALLRYRFDSLKTLLAHKTNVRHLLKAMEETEAKVFGTSHDSPQRRMSRQDDTYTPNGFSFSEIHSDNTDSEMKIKRKGSGKGQKPKGKEFYL